MTWGRAYPLLDLDPDLGQLLSEERRSDAIARLQVEVQRLPPGRWMAERLAHTSPEHIGLLVVEGVLSREVIVAGTVSTELLGPGEVVRPWSVFDVAPLLPLAVRWVALTETRVAILDRYFGARSAQWPEITSVLVERLNARAERLATIHAISQVTRVDRQLLALFWHLAERWGRVTSAGVVVPLTLSHRLLGQIVGARRPTVSIAIGELTRRGDLIRRDDGTWLLTGEPVAPSADNVEPIVPLRRRLLPDVARDRPAL